MDDNEAIKRIDALVEARPLADAVGWAFAVGTEVPRLYERGLTGKERARVSEIRRWFVDADGIEDFPYFNEKPIMPPLTGSRAQELFKEFLKLRLLALHRIGRIPPWKPDDATD